MAAYKLTWTAASTGGSASISGYEVIYTPLGGSPTVVQTGSTATTYILTGLTDGVVYSFGVRVAGGAITPPTSELVLSADPPAQVAGLAVGATGDGTIDLSWSAPASDATITDYSVEYTDVQPLTGVALLAPLDSDLDDVLGITATATNTPTITSGGKFGSYADLGAADKLTYSSVSFGSGDYTVEMWIRRTESSWSPNGGNPLLELPGVAMIGRVGTDTLGLYEDDFGSWVAVSGTTTSSIDQDWHHVALVRDGSTLRFYVDGSQVGTMSTSSNPSSLVFGASNIYGCRFGLDDLRVSTSAVYPGGTTFTPPATAHPTSGGGTTATVLVGSATTSYQLTGLTNGTQYSVRVAAASAAGTGAYSTAVTGTPAAAAPSTTSVLLNYNNSLTDSGPTGYTFTPSNTPSFDAVNVKFGSHSRAFQLYQSDANTGSHWQTVFTGDFTVEMFWRYNPNVMNNTAWAAGAWGMFDSSGSNYDGCAIFADAYSSNAIGWYWYLGGSGSSGTIYSSTPLIDDGTFRHVAIVREGTEFRLYYDGSLIASNTQSNNNAPFVSTSHDLKVGIDPYMMGYDGTDGNVDDFRISSSALYSGATYTIPASELT